MKSLDSNLCVRVSSKLNEELKAKAKEFKVTPSKLVRIAIEFVSEDDVLEHKLKNHGYKKPK